MLQLIRLVLLNVVWLGLAGWAFIEVWGLGTFLAMLIWSGAEMVLIYAPILTAIVRQSLHDGRRENLHG